MRAVRSCLLLALAPGLLPAQAVKTLPPQERQFVAIDAPVVALTHVTVIDGTGAEPAATTRRC